MFRTLQTESPSLPLTSENHFCALRNSSESWKALTKSYIQFFSFSQFVSLCFVARNNHLKFRAQLYHLWKTKAENGLHNWISIRNILRCYSLHADIPPLFQLEVKVLSLLQTLDEAKINKYFVLISNIRYSRYNKFNLI